MIEIAIALGVIGFALVAIVGVLPYGLNSQKMNREDTIVNQDSAYFMEAIRSGSRGLDELTNNVQKIFITTIGPSLKTTNYYVYNDGFRSGSNIIGLLSCPKFFYDTNGVRIATNYITAEVRALSGSALEQGANNDLTAFKYLMTCELVPLETASPTTKPPMWLKNHSYDLRLNFQWPLIVNPAITKPGKVPGKPSQMTVRSLISGKYGLITNEFYFFDQQAY